MMDMTEDSADDTVADSNYHLQGQATCEPLSSNASYFFQNRFLDV
jgi:hypothetical protein